VTLIPCKCVSEPGCLFLPRGWETGNPWIGIGSGLDRVGVIYSHKVYFTKHGPLWKDLDGNVYRLYNFTGPSSTIVGKLNRWYSQSLHHYIMAKRVNYDELLLEDIFSP